MNELEKWMLELKEAAKAGDRRQVLVAQQEIKRLNNEANFSDFKDAGIDGVIDPATGQARAMEGSMPSQDRGQTTAGYLGGLQGLGGAAAATAGASAGVPLGPLGVIGGGLAGYYLGRNAVKPTAQAIAGAIPGGVSASDVGEQWDATVGASPWTAAGAEAATGLLGGLANRAVVGGRTAVANMKLKELQVAQATQEALRNKAAEQLTAQQARLAAQHQMTSMRIASAERIAAERANTAMNATAQRAAANADKIAAAKAIAQDRIALTRELAELRGTQVLSQFEKKAALELEKLSRKSKSVMEIAQLRSQTQELVANIRMRVQPPPPPAPVPSATAGTTTVEEGASALKNAHAIPKANGVDLGIYQAIDKDANLLTQLPDADLAIVAQNIVNIPQVLKFRVATVIRNEVARRSAGR
jgi:hypothetical protein